jgi:hypothetical protein
VGKPIGSKWLVWRSRESVRIRFSWPGRSSANWRRSIDRPIGASARKRYRKRSAGKRLWKRRSLREFGNPKAISTFPQPRRRRRIYGYITNFSTIDATYILKWLDRVRKCFLPRFAVDHAGHCLGTPAELVGLNP